MKTNYLARFPPELYFYITNFLTPCDLASLSRVSKFYHAISQSELYRNIHLEGSVRQAWKCFQALHDYSDTLPRFVHRLTLTLPEDDYLDTYEKQIKDVRFWRLLNSALENMDNLMELDLECPYHADVLATLLSRPKDQLSSLSLLHVDDYTRHAPSELDQTYGTPPTIQAFNLEAKFPSLINLDIQIAFFVDSTLQKVIHNFIANHAEQLQALSLYIRAISRNGETAFLPDDIILPNVQYLADLPPAYLTPLLPRQVPNITNLTFATVPFGPLLNLDFSNAFHKLEKIEATYTILQLFLSSPRTLRSIEMQPSMDTTWKDIRATVGLLRNCSSSLRVLHLDLFVMGAKLNELWSLIPPLPNLESILFRVAPDWYSFDLRIAVEMLVSLSKTLLSKLPKLQTFVFLEGCPSFPMSSFKDFAVPGIQKHILDHWECEGIPPPIREVIFTSNIRWVKNNSWVARPSKGDFDRYQVGIHEAFAEINLDNSET